MTAVSSRARKLLGMVALLTAATAHASSVLTALELRRHRYIGESYKQRITWLVRACTHVYLTSDL